MKESSLNAFLQDEDQLYLIVECSHHMKESTGNSLLSFSPLFFSFWHYVPLFLSNILGRTTFKNPNNPKACGYFIFTFSGFAYSWQ